MKIVFLGPRGLQLIVTFIKALRLQHTQMHVYINDLFWSCLSKISSWRTSITWVGATDMPFELPVNRFKHILLV